VDRTSYGSRAQQAIGEGVDDQLKTVNRTIVLHLFLLLCIVLLSGALQRPLGGDTLEGSMTGGFTRAQNQIILVLGAGVYAAALSLLVFHTRKITVYWQMWPALALNMLAIISVLWSVNPSQTLLRSAGLTGCTIIAVYTISTFSLREFLRQLVHFSVALVLFTFAAALLSRGYAYHGTSEFYSEHAGLLKGFFVHKNTFAKILSVCLIILVCWGGQFIRIRWLFWAVLICGFYLLYQTGSAKTFASVPFAIVGGYIFAHLRTSGQRLGFLIFGILAWTVVEAFDLIGWAMSLALEVLDRDPTLSGRTLIWQGAFEGVLRQNIFLGGGYEAAWQGVIGETVRAWAGFDPGHPHNGFINTILELGIVGLAVLAVHFLVLTATLVSLPKGTSRRLHNFVVSWTILLITNNLSGTFMMLPGDLYWYLLLLAPAMMRWNLREDPVR